MSALLQSFVGVGFLAFFIASSVVGVRLLLLWRRTRELPELLIGLGVLGIGPVGFGFITVGELCVAGAPGLARILIGTGLAAMSVGCRRQVPVQLAGVPPAEPRAPDAGRRRLPAAGDLPRLGVRDHGVPHAGPSRAELLPSHRASGRMPALGLRRSASLLGPDAPPRAALARRSGGRKPVPALGPGSGRGRASARRWAASRSGGRSFPPPSCPG